MIGRPGMILVINNDELVEGVMYMDYDKSSSKLKLKLLVGSSAILNLLRATTGRIELLNDGMATEKLLVFGITDVDILKLVYGLNEAIEATLELSLVSKETMVYQRDHELGISVSNKHTVKLDGEVLGEVVGKAIEDGTKRSVDYLKKK